MHSLISVVNEERDYDNASSPCVICETDTECVVAIDKFMMTAVTLSNVKCSLSVIDHCVHCLLVRQSR
jgi:hypothetical protein